MTRVVDSRRCSDFNCVWPVHGRFDAVKLIGAHVRRPMPSVAIEPHKDLVAIAPRFVGGCLMVPAAR